MEFTLLLVGYLAGSLPSAYFIAKGKGIDIRSVGSGSAGGTNLARHLGWRWGALAVFLDGFKSFMLVLFAQSAQAFDWLPFAVVGVTALGSIFPVFLGFKGGKGFSVLLGGTIPLIPWHLFLILLGVWIFLLVRTRTMAFVNVSIAVLFGLAFTAFHAALLPYGAYGAFTVLALVFSHRENLIRIWRGTEPQISFQW